jgi:predicted HTH transcriptional regulator
MLGSEIHIDIYDDRLEISSPGGMYGGRAIQEQDIYRLRSDRRNPILADLFHRMKYMERRGSGLKKIVEETKKLPGYTDDLLPEFYSTESSFAVVLKNMNYGSRPSDDSFGKSFGANFGLNEAQSSVLRMFAEDPTITSQAVADVLGVTRRTVENHASRLKKSGAA